MGLLPTLMHLGEHFNVAQRSVGTSSFHECQNTNHEVQSIFSRSIIALGTLFFILKDTDYQCTPYLQSKY